MGRRDGVVKLPGKSGCVAAHEAFEPAVTAGGAGMVPCTFCLSLGSPSLYLRGQAKGYFCHKPSSVALFLLSFH